MTYALANNSESIARLLDVIRANQQFLLTSHARPDGDAIGSTLGFMHLLRSMGKQATVVFADPVPPAFQDLPGAHEIRNTLPSDPSEVLIIMECDCVERTGYTSIPAQLTINIDHHLSGRDYGDHNWIDAKACAVGAMVYEIAVASGVPIAADMASCLYAAVLTDTGGFLHATTTASTFALAQHLLEAGADARAVTEAVYFNMPRSRMKLLGLALTRMETRGNIAWSWVTQEDMAKLDASQEDCEGVVNHLIGIEGICAAAFLRETPEGQFRLSMRSKHEVDVAAIATGFAGGGHRNASGGTLEAPLDRALSQVLTALEDACAVHSHRPVLTS